MKNKQTFFVVWMDFKLNNRSSINRERNSRCAAIHKKRKKKKTIRMSRKGNEMMIQRFLE